MKLRVLTLTIEPTNFYFLSFAKTERTAVVWNVQSVTCAICVIKIRRSVSGIFNVKAVARADYGEIRADKEFRTTGFDLIVSN